MKATKMTLMVALAVGSLLTLSPALLAGDATNTPSSVPPMGGPPPGGMHRHSMRGPNFDRMTERLNLTDDQKTKVEAIFKAQREQMHGVWQDQSLSRKDRRTKMESIHKATMTKLKAVLTVDQFKQLQGMRPRMGGPQHRPPWGPPPGAPPSDNGGTNAPPQT